MNAAPELLDTRTLARFKRAHVIEAADGLRINLDLDVTGATDDELYAAMEARARELDPGAVMPAAGRELWHRFIAIGEERRKRRTFARAPLPGMRRPKLSFIVRMETA